MKNLLISIFILFVLPLIGQVKISVTNDTLFNSEDSVVVFVTQRIDSLKMLEYYGAYTEWTHYSYRHGFLRLKKTNYRKRNLSHKWGNIYYDQWREVYPELRIPHDDLDISSGAILE